MDTAQKIKTFLVESNWLKGEISVAFLAAGEYNKNYLVTTGKGKQYVFRINYGSQLGLQNQIEYEYNALKAIEPSGVTSKVFEVDPKAEQFDGGVLLMQYLPGRQLNYQTDWRIAAKIFARIHSLPIHSSLIVQNEPVLDIAKESFELINRFSNHPLEYAKKKLTSYHKKILHLGEQTRSQFGKDRLCIVNSEVNSSNFIINNNQGHLVDWEKAVVSYRYQDLGHFLVKTSTRWKSDYTYTPKEKKEFLKYYRENLSEDLDFEMLIILTDVLEQTILLRALSWCYMAYYEYTMGKRTIKNEGTFNRIKSYLEDIDTLLS